MSDITDITNILTEELSTVYCNNCKFNEGDELHEECEDCHRKYMNWGLSKISAFKIAKKIINSNKESEVV